MKDLYLHWDRSGLAYEDWVSVWFVNTVRYWSMSPYILPTPLALFDILTDYHIHFTPYAVHYVDYAVLWHTY